MNTNGGTVYQKLHAIISGRVQGVGFRFFTEREAKKRNLSGWVRNNFDGSVELEAIGEEAQIEDFIAVLRRGPFMSRVDDVRFSREDTGSNSGAGFEIR